MSYPMLNSDFERLKRTPQLQGKAFGISQIQRYLGIGYNRAETLIKEALRVGVLGKDSECKWLVRLI